MADAAPSRRRRVVQHVRKHRRSYGMVTAGVVLGLIGDLALGIFGNIVYAVIQPWFGFR